MHGTLSVEASLHAGRTVLDTCRFTAPLKIAKPFYGDDGTTRLMLMAAAPGLLDGDWIDLDFRLGDGCKLRVQGQSCQKVFRSTGRGAGQAFTATLGAGAVLHYVPHPLIPFAGSVLASRADIVLDPAARLLYFDGLSAGRTAMGESCAFALLQSSLSVRVRGEGLCFVERSRLAQGYADFAGEGFFEGFAHTGFVYLFGYDAAFGQIRAQLADLEALFPKARVRTAVTRAARGLCVRALADTGEGLRAVAEVIETVCLEQTSTITHKPQKTVRPLAF
ncbi:MAG: urease accessory protein UreD [Clostridiales Family XIII bacterium]|jgi:urease accessory protein|nr:urease accessory protein UreD [Clostridiales Family XIII bacterium]